jgi:hypothetical protein
MITTTNAQNAQNAQKVLFKLVKLNKTKPEQVKYVFDNNPTLDINLKNAWGETLIYNCCKHAVNIPLLEWLYDQHCDPSIINKKGFNAFNACLEWNHKKNYELVLDWLFSKKIEITTYYKDMPVLHNMIICHGNTSSLPWICKHYNVNEQDPKTGNTPLHISVHQDTEHNNPAPCEYLCKNCDTLNVNVNIQNNNGDTALHLACYSGFSNCIREMLDTRECDLSLKNNKGKTAYDVCLVVSKCQLKLKWSGDYDESLRLMTNVMSSVQKM